jgi:flagellar hook protein FlgE
MSLLTSLSTGTTGLSSASAELSVVGDNIANANTVGFKEGRAAFEDALAQNVIGGTGQIGLGSRVQAVQKMITQGALTNTGNVTDLALQGTGFFELRGTAGNGRQGTFLTRAGQFTVDKDGYVVNLDGLRVQGYTADAAGNLTSSLGDLPVGNATSPPRATANITVKANLQADAALPAAWDPADPAGTSNFSTTVTLYDSLGKSYQAPVYFRNLGPGAAGGNDWEYHVMTDGANVQGGVAGTPSEIAAGNLSFDTQGLLVDVLPNLGLTFDPVGAVQPQDLNFNFGDPTNVPPGTGLAGITQFASPSATTFVGQDGFSAGELTSIQIDKKGIVNGMFTNGQTRALCQVGVARIAAPDQLERVGGNLFALTTSSGEAVMGAAGDGGRAFIAAGTLEQSNVDIAEQFVRMIAAQRNFQANSKTITTADQLLAELIAMKR